MFEITDEMRVAVLREEIAGCAISAINVIQYGPNFTFEGHSADKMLEGFTIVSDYLTTRAAIIEAEL